MFTAAYYIIETQQTKLPNTNRYNDKMLESQGR